MSKPTDNYMKTLERELGNAKSRIAMLELDILQKIKDLDAANADSNAMQTFDGEEIDVLDDREPAKVLDLIVQRHVEDMDDDTKEYWSNAIQKLR